MSADRYPLIKKIHVAKRQLFGGDEEAYRAALMIAVDKRSLKVMHVVELARVVEHFKTLGFKPAPGKSSKRKTLDSRPMARKLRALWINMGLDGIIRDRSEDALAAWVKKMTGLDALQFCSEGQLSILIAAAKKWRERAEAGAKDVELAIDTQTVNGIEITKVVEVKPK
jgi:phage gp16-like protein